VSVGSVSEVDVDDSSTVDGGVGDAAGGLAVVVGDD